MRFLYLFVPPHRLRVILLATVGVGLIIEYQVFYRNRITNRAIKTSGICRSVQYYVYIFYTCIIKKRPTAAETDVIQQLNFCIMPLGVVVVMYRRVLSSSVPLRNSFKSLEVHNKGVRV